MVDAQAEPNDLKAQISAIRSWAYFRITGKKLPKIYTSSGPEDSTVTDIGSDLSPSRRLARRSK